MPHQPDDADPDRWLRYFAMDANMWAAMLLAEVHALLGFDARALAWAVEVRDYFAARDTADWEMAFAHNIVALDAIADVEDRRIVALTFDQVPDPE